MTYKHALRIAKRARLRGAHSVARKYRQIARSLRAISTVSAKGVALVAAFEGFSSKPYKDAVGVWTIGYGETRNVGPGTRPWSKRKAQRRLKQRLNEDFLPAVKAAERVSGKRLNQNQVDALTSFVYNVGPGGLGNTKIGRAVRAGKFNAAADHLLEWDKAGGKTLLGLTRRRQAERKLFLS